KTLFATHYHELNEMTSTFDRIKSYNVSVKELKDSVLFLRKLVPGGSEHSFGIHVAKMAGMPQQSIHRANVIRRGLEKSYSSEELPEKLNPSQQVRQLSCSSLDDPLVVELKEEILATDIVALTRVDTVVKLREVQIMLAKSLLSLLGPEID